jgi:hypothetical protein
MMRRYPFGSMTFFPERANGFSMGSGETIRSSVTSSQTTLVAASATIYSTERGDHDRLFGEAGFDTLIGGSGNDKLVGGGGGDKLNGGGGNDELIGASGQDVLRSGSGSDVFIFSRMAGVDIIKDFDNGRDKIEITDGARSYRDLDISRSKGDVVVEFAGTEVIIEDVAFRSITESDFLFT